MRATRRSRSKILRAIVAGGDLVALLVVAGAALSIVLATRRYRSPFPEPCPQVGWARVEALRIETSDGLELGAWHCAVAGTGPAVLVLHGQGGSRSASLERARILAELGSPSLLVSLRAHGDSEGDAHDFGPSARADVVAGVAALRARGPGRRVVVLGSSLGAAAALFAARELGDDVDGYVFECPYRDLRTALHNRLVLHLPDLVVAPIEAVLVVVASVVRPELLDRAPLDHARDVPPRTPVAIFAGADDRHALASEAAALAERLGARARLVTFPGCGHDRLANEASEAYRRELASFLGSVGSP